MEHFKNPYDTRIKEIDDVLDKRFGEAKTAGDWEKRVKALEAEQAKLKEGGDDFSYYKKAIFDAKKKKAENMDDGSLEEQRKKIEEFEALREEEDKGLLEKIATMRTDEKLEKSEKSKKLEELEKDRNKKLAYYEKKINEVEDKIKPKSEEEFAKKIDDVEARRSEKLRRMGRKDGKILADVTFYDKQIADAQREFDKIVSLREERPVQFELEAGLKTLKRERDNEITQSSETTAGKKFEPAINKFNAFLKNWRRIDIIKNHTAKQWKQRADDLIELEVELQLILQDLAKDAPTFKDGAKHVEETIVDAIKKQIKKALDEIDDLNKTNAKTAEQAASSQAHNGVSPGATPENKQPAREGALEGLMTKEEEMAEAQKGWKPIQFLVEDLITRLKKVRGTENIVDTLYQFEIDWRAIDEKRPETGMEWIKRLDALRALKMGLFNAKESLADMKIDVDYDTIDNEIADVEEFLTTSGKKATQSWVSRDTFEGGGGI